MTARPPLDSREALAEKLCRIQGRRVLVIGDLMLDQFVDGRVLRMSPEAPIPVLSQTRTHQMPGGAANVARNLAWLGVATDLLGVLGEDAEAAALADRLDSLPAITLAAVTSAGRRTSCKIRYRTDNRQLLRVDHEQTNPISQAEQDRLCQLAEQKIAAADLVILSDYAKGCLPPEMIARLAGLAAKQGKILLVDPKSPDFNDYKGAQMITPNLAELQVAAGRALGSEADIAEAAAGFVEQLGLQAMLVTLSEKGMAWITRQGWQLLPARAREVYDVSGAGDTVIAGLAAGLAGGLDSLEAVQLANLAAGLVVGKEGTSAVCPGELLADFGAGSADLGLETLQPSLAGWRGQGQQIGFTNGCFDLLHPGHISLLQRAAELCDRLIVGLNSDASVSRLKGPQRPVQNARQRGNALAALPFVDAVVLFEEDTPARLIAEIEPQHLIKGGDYQPEEIVGHDTVRARGGQVHALPLLDRFSTSSQLPPTNANTDTVSD